MRRVHALVAAVILAACGGDGATGPSTRDFVGTWDLVDSRVVSQADASVFEILCCQAGETEVLRLLSDGTYVDTYDPGGGPVTVTGGWSVRGDSMFVTFDAQPGLRVAFGVTLRQGIMTWKQLDVWDFDGDGTDEPAYLQVRYAKR